MWKVHESVRNQYREYLKRKYTEVWVRKVLGIISQTLKKTGPVGAGSTSLAECY